MRAPLGEDPIRREQCAVYWSPSESLSSLLGRGSSRHCRRPRIVLAVATIIVVLAVAGVVVNLAVTAARGHPSVAIIAVSSAIAAIVVCCVAVVATAIVVLVVAGVAFAFHLALGERPGGNTAHVGVKTPCEVTLVASGSGAAESPHDNKMVNTTAPKKAPGVARRLQLREGLDSWVRQQESSLHRGSQDANVQLSKPPQMEQQCHPVATRGTSSTQADHKKKMSGTLGGTSFRPNSDL
ncbi:hypothetical protein EDB87DRAFT_1823177 [Lactarius vividus]|nr:hypothetical protein EDB87DRAFT_1823177 [Lactarius vividus]